jgi:hypothetical protein
MGGRGGGCGGIRAAAGLWIVRVMVRERVGDLRRWGC